MFFPLCLGSIVYPYPCLAKLILNNILWVIYLTVSLDIISQWVHIVGNKQQKTNLSFVEHFFMCQKCFQALYLFNLHSNIMSYVLLFSRFTDVKMETQEY